MQLLLFLPCVLTVWNIILLFADPWMYFIHKIQNDDSEVWMFCVRNLTFCINTEHLARLLLRILFKQPIWRLIWKLNWMLSQESGYTFKYSRRANQSPIPVDIVRNMVTCEYHDIYCVGGGRQDCNWYIWTYAI